jgi:hypothetical protein
MAVIEEPCGCVRHEQTHYTLTKHCPACMRKIVEHENRYAPPPPDNSDLVGG